MSAPQAHADPLADAQAAVLLRQVALSQAAHLARDGSYAAAEELLSGVLATERPDASVLDLLARIRVQQGALLDAESLWRKVLQLDPNHLGASAGLERLRGVQRTPVWLQPVLVALIGFGAILCGALVLSRQANRQSNTNAQLYQQVQTVLTSVQTLSSNQTRAEGGLSKLGDFGRKLDGWSVAQGAVASQLTEIKAEAIRSAGRQESVAQVASNQVNILHRAFEQELASVKDNFAQQMGALQGEGKKLAAQQEAGGQTISNQVATLRLVMDRERVLTAELEQRRAAAEKLQSDYRTLATSHETLLAQAGLATKPPNVTIAVPGVTALVSGKAVMVTFDEGLFDHGTHFKLGAKERVLVVAKALSLSLEPLRIEVVGYADDDRAFLKWTAQWESALALGRASVAVDHFIRFGLFKPERLAAIGGTAPRPHPSDSAQNRLRNRTVVLRISIENQIR